MESNSVDMLAHEKGKMIMNRLSKMDAVLVKDEGSRRMGTHQETLILKNW
jgi:hypothetical protein